MDKPEVSTNDQKLFLSQALLDYYDEFVNFNEDCAFFCDAFSIMVENYELLDEHSIRGMARNADWLKQQTKAFKDKLYKIRELESTECD